MYWKKVCLSMLFIAGIGMLTFFFNINIFQESFVADNRLLFLLYVINYSSFCSIFGSTIIFGDIKDKSDDTRIDWKDQDDLPDIDRPSKYVLRYGKEEIEFTHYNQNIVRRLWDEM